MKRTANFRDHTILYTKQGGGKTIVLLHGFLESQVVWKNFARKLSGSYQVISIDLPGHGGSDVISEGLTMDLMAEAVMAVLTRENVTSCLMVGHSMGGYVALAFADKYRKILKGVVLFHSQAAADSPETILNRDRTIALVKKDRKGFIASFIPDLFDPANLERYGKEIALLKNLALETSAESIVAALEAMKIRPDRTHILANAEFPVCFIIGKSDYRIPMELIVPQVTLPVHSEALLLDKVGHKGFIEAAGQTFEAIHCFARRTLR